MGKNLHYTIIQFFEARMSEHSGVRSFRQMPSSDEFIYEITRARFGDAIHVWLADQYDFGEMDFYNRPREIRAGDYILIARPEARAGDYSQEKIRIGKIGDFMGALNKQKMWEYEPPSDEEKRRRRSQKER